MVPPAAARFARLVAAVPWVTDVWLSGSAATGDYRPGRSDLDLVALTDGPVDAARRDALEQWHRVVDTTPGPDVNLGCVYVDAAHLDDVVARWPTWTHHRLIDRPLSLLARAELGVVAETLKGRPAAQVWAPFTSDEIRAAALAELTGPWSAAARRPWQFADPAFCDLALLSMARGRHSLATGRLLTKTDAVDHVACGPRLQRDIRARRVGTPVRSNRFRLAWAAWRDTVRTTRSHR